MVSKGVWKQTRNEENWYNWEKQSSSSYYDNYSISVSKMYSDKIINNPIKGKYTWVVQYGKGINNEHKVFKDKSQALSFAKQYMRTH